MQTRRTVILGAMAAPISQAIPFSGWAQGGPKRGGTLSIGYDNEPSSLDPIRGTAQGNDPDVYNQFYDKLFILNSAGEIVPQLATSWKIAEDDLSIAFQLRPGVVFHDGTPFDAAAVKFSLERAIDKRTSLAAGFVPDLAGVDIVDPLNVVVRFGKVSGASVTGLASQAGCIVSPTAVAAKGNDFSRSPVGTGPFVFKQWIGGDRIVAARNDAYWARDAAGRPLPHLDGVVTRFITNTSVKIVQLEANAVQLINTIQAKDFDRIEAMRELKLIDNPQGMNMWLAFNCSRAPTNNVDLRKAICYGIDRVSIEKVITRGRGAVHATYWFEPDWVHEPSIKGYVYDSELAKRHLAASGHRGGLELSITQRDPDTQIAQLIQAQLGQMGIPVRITAMERAGWLQKVKGRDFDIATGRGQQPRADPDITFAGTFAPRGAASYSAMVDDELGREVELGRSHIDREKRRPHYVRAQQILIDQAYYGFIFTMPQRDAAVAGLNGLEREVSANWLLQGAWLA